MLNFIPFVTSDAHEGIFFEEKEKEGLIERRSLNQNGLSSCFGTGLFM